MEHLRKRAHPKTKICLKFTLIQNNKCFLINSKNKKQKCKNYFKVKVINSNNHKFNYDIDLLDYL
jgi:hypothetical protein